MSQVTILKHVFKNVLSLSKHGKLVLIFNYHRIGKVDISNPYHRLHTISPKIFKQQINLLKILGTFVSPDDIHNYKKLSKINFCITFDDVSSSILSITPFLEKNKIPYTIAPCALITENGYGVRDKVYFINHYIPKETLFSFVQENFTDTFEESFENFSFYSFTKNTDYDLLKIHNEIVKPLFEQLDSVSKNKFFEGGAYFTWTEIKKHFCNNPWVTIANHSLTHHNMANFDKNQVREEVEKSIALFKKNLEIEPIYFSVPFGQPSQNLAVDLNEILREKGYKGVFWVTGKVNKYLNDTPNQILHFARIHAAPQLKNFLITSLKALSKANQPFRKFFFKSKFQVASKIKTVGSNEELPLLAIENILREGRDYASSPHFYNYYFDNNPNTKEQKHYFASIGNERIEAIGANLYYQLIINGRVTPASVWSNWRKLPYTNNLSGGMILRKAIQNTPVLIAYKSSEQARIAYSGKNWKKVKVTRLTWNINNLNNIVKTSSNIIANDSFPIETEELINDFNKRVQFSIYRDAVFYQWRYDQYPLAKAKYFYLKEAGEVKSFCVVLVTYNKASISDFIYKREEDFINLIPQVEAYIKEQGVGEVFLETNQSRIIERLTAQKSLRKSEFWNYYHFNKRKLEEGIVLEELIKNWNDKAFIFETRASGDVFIR